MLHWAKLIIGRFDHFWKQDPGLSSLLIILGILLFVFYPLAAIDVIGDLIINVFFALLLISGVVSVIQNRFLIRLMTCFSILVFIISWIDLYTTDPLIAIIHSLSSLVFFSFLAWMVLLNVFKAGPMNWHRIQGAIVAYLLIGLILSFAYQTIYFWVPQPSFHIINPLNRQFEPEFEFLYFSITTLTSLGYGDITPLHPFAQSLSMVEGLIGQLYPAILIARLMALRLDADSDTRV